MPYDIEARFPSPICRNRDFPACFYAKVVGRHSEVHYQCTKDSSETRVSVSTKQVVSNTNAAEALSRNDGHQYIMAPAGAGRNIITEHRVHD